MVSCTTNVSCLLSSAGLQSLLSFEELSRFSGFLLSARQINPFNLCNPMIVFEQSRRHC